MDRLPFRWRVRAAVASLVLPVLIQLFSFRWVMERLSRMGSHDEQLPKDDELATWVTGFLGRLPAMWSPTCLRRSVVMFYLLRRANHTVQLCVGVHREGNGEFRAHAWLVKDGLPYLEPDIEAPARYQIIAEFPEASAARSA